MNAPQPNVSSPRGRGRPKGTAKYEQADLALLAKFADLQVSSPGSKLATFLAPRGHSVKDIRRMQKRWRFEQTRLLEEAKLRADAADPTNLAELVVSLFAAISDVAAAALPALNKMSASLERARARVRARERLKLGSVLPLDLEDDAAVEQAIRDYEATVGAGHLPPEFKRMTDAQLPLSLKLYSTAITLHQCSLIAAAEEARSATSMTGDAAVVGEARR